MHQYNPLINSAYHNTLGANGNYFSQEANDNIIDNFEVLDTIIGLENNWDGNGAIPPSTKVIENTKYFISILPKIAINLLNNERITPTPYGTVVLDFEKSNNLLSIEIGENMIGYFTDFADSNISPSNDILVSDDKKISELFFLFKKFAS